MNPQAQIIDLSHYNGVVDFEKVKATGIQVVILKATQGVSIIDSVLLNNAKNAYNAGLLIGAYHFGTSDDPLAQANNFLGAIKPIRGYTKILPVLDFERNPSLMTLQEAKTWLNSVQSVLDVVPVLYIGEYLKSFGKQEVLLNYPLWISEYGPEVKLPIGYDTWTAWQFTDGHLGPLPHNIDGVNGPVDISTFNGTNDQLKEFWAAHSA